MLIMVETLLIIQLSVWHLIRARPVEQFIEYKRLGFAGNLSEPFMVLSMIRLMVWRRMCGGPFSNPMMT